MVRDTALILRKAHDEGEAIDLRYAQMMLASSNLVSRLLTEPKQKPHTFVGLRALEWRLLELSEIPYTHTLERVREWIDLLVERTSLSEGFSLTGHRDGVLSCHNAMIAYILMKMEHRDFERIHSGIDWIVTYQSVERGVDCTWTGKDLFTRWGGCMKKTPCFYGVVKSMKALTEYAFRFGSFPGLEGKLARGLEYILRHRVFKKLSVPKPIEPSITENFYPYPYKTNILEILVLLGRNGLLRDTRCNEAIRILKNKRRSDGLWQADASYMKSAWVDFDIPGKPGEWITYVIEKLLSSEEIVLG